MEQALSFIPAEPRHYPAILALNEELVHFLAPMNQEYLLHLASMCKLFHVVEVDGDLAAFVMALPTDTAYDNENYLWFTNNCKDFLYIDRIVLSPRFHRRGIGAFIYRHVFDYARQMGATCLTAEIDILPPNPVSLAFHATLGFEEIGKQFVYGGKKQVSLQAAPVR